MTQRDTLVEHLFWLVQQLRKGERIELSSNEALGGVQCLQVTLLTQDDKKRYGRQMLYTAFNLQQRGGPSFEDRIASDLELLRQAKIEG